jgi:hypothetical protein
VRTGGESGSSRPSLGVDGEVPGWPHSDEANPYALVKPTMVRAVAASLRRLARLS